MHETRPIQDFRVYLQQELLERCESNAAYSLRAFAKALDIEASTLSRIFRGQRNLTKKTFNRLASRLALDPLTKNQFAEFHFGPPVLNPLASLSKDTQSFQSISLEAFRFISDWYHHALLELLRLSHVKKDTRSLAKALGLKQTQVNIALTRLESLKLIEKDEKGDWTYIGTQLSNIRPDFSDEARRKLQKQVLQKAIDALENVAIEKRDNTSMTICVDLERLGEAKEKIKRFRRELSQFLEGGKKFDEVYHLVVALYPVTQTKTGSK